MTIDYGTVVVIVLGLTEWIKTKLNLVNTAAEVSSALVGLFLGGVYQYTISAPTELNGWMNVLIVGLATALIPSGLYKFTNTVASKFTNLVNSK